MQVDTIKIIANGIELNMVLSIPLIRRWYWESGDHEALQHTGNSLKLEVYFAKYTIVKGFHTAWNLGEFSIAFEENDEPFEMTMDVDSDEPWHFNQTVNTTLPVSVPMITSVPVKRLNVTLYKTESQLSPFFDIRGCPGEGW